MKQIANHIFQAVWQITLSIVFLGTLFPISTYAEESLCAVVKIEIKQELTLERQAFDAHMRINNGLSHIQLENVEINVSFADEDGNSVRATSDSNDTKDTKASFFIQIDSMDGISDVAGSGTVAPSSSADIHWLIIPARGSGGTLPSGTLYYVGATLKYTLGGETHTTEVTPDYIFVKPQPLLTLDYFLPRDVYADDAFTPEIEPPIPFTLGVRVKNEGYSVARHLKIDSAQPRIVENKQGLSIGFKIMGSTVNNQPATPSLLVDFGDIEAQQSAVGRWQMTTTLSGEFTDFKAEYYHADELGGELTSLIQDTHTHFLIKDVLVDLPGRDDNRDFLADEGGVVRVYESHGLDTEVNDYSANTTMQLANQSGLQATYHLNAPVTEGFLYVKLPDPHQGSKALERAVRSDGKVLILDNVWLSKTRREDNGWDYFINLFDNNSTGQYQITLDTANLAPQPPVLQFIPDRSTRETQQISFLVEASDPNGTIPSLSASALPTGANFTVQSDKSHGLAIFDWTPMKGQAGDYEITFTASDGSLDSSQSARITVNAMTEDTDGDGMLDEACERHYFSTLDREGSGDFDGDGISDQEECLLGTDPTVKMPNIIINEVDALAKGSETTEFIELYDGGTGKSSLEGLVVVLFNGEGDQAYKAFDLDGFMTDASGYFVIGGSGVSKANKKVPQNDWLADGADAVALYMGNEADFPEGAAITTAKLLDALVYDTDDAEDTGLLSLLNPGEAEINEGGAGDAEQHSNQRCEKDEQGNSSHYIQVTPTPGVANHCQANLSIMMAASSDPINLGGELSYTLTVNNAGPNVASTVQVVDTLPNEVSFESASGTDWTCREDRGTVTCQLPTLAVGEAHPITLNVIAPNTTGQISNQATVSAASSDVETNNNSASETTPVKALPLTRYSLTVNKVGNGTVTGSGIDCGNDCLNDYDKGTHVTLNATPDSGWQFEGWSGDCDNHGEVEMSRDRACTASFTQPITPPATQQADLSLTQSDSVDPVEMGSRFSYKITVNNAGPNVANTVQVVDTLPNAVKLDSASGTDWDCSETGGTVTCELATLAIGEANPITFNVIAPNTASEISNQAIVTSKTSDPDTNNNSASETTSVNQTPAPPISYSLKIQKLGKGTVMGSSIDCGEDCQQDYDSDTKVSLTATPDSGWQFDGWGGDCDSHGQVEMSRDRACTASFTQPITPPATQQAELSLTQTDSVDPIEIGSPFSYSLTVNNAGPNVANTVQVVDTLPNGVKFENASGTDWDCSETSGTVTCELATLAIGEDNPITINVIAPNTTGEISNQATVTSETLDPDTTNNSASETTSVNQTPAPPISYSLKVQKLGKGTVTGSGIHCGEECQQDYDSSTKVSLTATPDSGWQFDGWSGDCDSHGQIQMDSDKSCLASFVTETTIETDPLPGIPQFTTKTLESDESASSITLTVSRVGGSDGKLTVKYTTSEGNATAGSDYVETSGSLTWTDGDKRDQTLTVAITDDTTIEDNETFSINLFDASGTRLDSATVSIIDDDTIVVVQAGTAQFASTTVTVVETNPIVTLTVSRVEGSEGTLTVKYATREGSATAGSDYLETEGSLTWTDGENRAQSLTVAIIDDTTIEGNETVKITLLEETGSAHLDSATLFILDNETQPITGCPLNGVINSSCRANGQSLINVSVGENVSMAGAVFEGRNFNHGFVSNSLIEVGAELIGGLVSGYITNHGIMKDFEFVGASIKGGTLSGDIINNSKVGGTFYDVQFAANTHLSGGYLKGVIAGDINAPTWLKNVKVKNNSHLSGVILTDTVQLGDNVVLGEGVRFSEPQLIPLDLELSTLLPALPASEDCLALQTGLKRVDLSQDILEPVKGLLKGINTLTGVQDNNWFIEQDECGALHLSIDTLHFSVQPLSVIKTHLPAGIEELAQQQVRLTTETGLTILSHPTVQAPKILEASLAEWGLADAILQANGNLHIQGSGEDWYSARPDWLSVELETATKTGLFLTESPYISGIFTAYLILTDNNGQYRRQFLYPAPASVEVLYAMTEELVIKPYGLVSFKRSGQSYHGIVDYLVSSGTPPTHRQLQIKALSDVNGDGLDDWLLIYPNGDKQKLFQSEF